MTKGKQRGIRMCIVDGRSATTSKILPLDEAIASIAVIVIVSGLEGRTETLFEPAK